MSKKLILVRHTTTSWNREKRLQGQTDIELDNGGREEAQQLALLLAELGIQKIISSNLKRASQTAEIIAAKLGLPVVINEQFMECSFGSLEGMTQNEAVARYGDTVLTHLKDDAFAYDFESYGGEKQEQVKERHLQALDEMRAMPEDIILVVGHGRGLNTLLSVLDEEVELKRNEWRTIDI